MAQHKIWMRRWGAAALAAALALSLPACSQGERAVSSSAPSAAESQPTPTPAPTAAPTPSPTPSPTPEPESTPAAGDFEAEFGENPIDQQYEESLSLATSYTLMQQACDTAAGQWRQMVRVAYQAAQEALTGEDLARLQQEQQEWEAGLDSSVEELRAQSDGTQDGAFTTAQSIVDLYRQRAKELCQTVYQATGQMPDFEAASASSGEPVG